MMTLKQLLQDIHIVQPGESLITIADHVNVDWEELAKLNNITSLRQVHPGLILRLSDIDLKLPQLRDHSKYQDRPPAHAC